MKRGFDHGRGGEIRTRDPHNPIVVRYQAALRPDGSINFVPYPTNLAFSQLR